MSNEKALPKYQNVTIGEETFKVEKLPLGNYVELIQVLKNLPSSILTELKSIDTENEGETIQAIVGLFGDSWGQVLDIISIGSGVDRERIENDPEIGIDGGIALFKAIYEVNNLGNVVKQTKNIFSRPNNQ